MIYKLNYTIGIPRTDLPQIEDEYHSDILKDMDNDNISYVNKDMGCKELKPSQDELNLEKISGMRNEGNHLKSRSIFVSEDNFIVDGHHVWAARMLDDPNMEINCYKVNMNIIDLINWFNSHDFTYSKKITEGKNA